MKNDCRFIIMRGLPGAGKDTYLKDLSKDEDFVVCSADDFFMENGSYNFDPRKLGEAHEYCKKKCFGAAKLGKSIAISNTNVKHWEYEFYIMLGEHFGYEVEIHSVFDGGCTDEQLAARNLHGVPVESIARMRENYE